MAEHGFAIQPPADWIVLTSQNMDALLGQMRDRLPEALQQVLRSGGVALACAKLEVGARMVPVLDVVVLPGQPPPFDEKAREQVTREAETQLRAVLPDYALETTGWAELDAMRTIRMRGRATLRIKIKEAVTTRRYDPLFGRSQKVVLEPAEFEETSLTFVQYLIRGAGRGYVLSFIAPTERFSEYEGEFSVIAASFRVLKHAPRFGNVLDGTLRGAAIGGLLGVGWMLFKRFRREGRE